jgi:hypothetical protein
MGSPPWLLELRYNPKLKQADQSARILRVGAEPVR